jgi:hypothetical protein
MHAKEILQKLREQPFEPFAIHMSDGSSYAITHPDQVLLTPTIARIGIKPGPDPKLAEEIATCSLVYVARLAPHRPRSPERTGS